MKKTEENLRAAFAGESQARMKYQIFSDKAEKENYLNVARLFEAVSFAEKVHATNHLRILGEIRKTSENLQEAINGENYEVEEMYPSFHETAISEGEKRAEQSMKWALEAEKVHRTMYTSAKEAVDEGRDIDIGPIHICGVCGYTVEGEAPDVCPICRAKKELFRKF